MSIYIIGTKKNKNNVIVASFIVFWDNLDNDFMKNIEVYTWFYGKNEFENNGASFVMFRVRLLCRLASEPLSCKVYLVYNSYPLRSISKPTLHFLFDINGPSQLIKQTHPFPLFI